MEEDEYWPVQTTFIMRLIDMYKCDVKNILFVLILQSCLPKSTHETPSPLIQPSVLKTRQGRRAQAVFAAVPLDPLRTLALLAQAMAPVLALEVARHLDTAEILVVLVGFR